jgi:Mn-dependent DtxR family transcriptional regulator
VGTVIRLNQISSQLADGEAVASKLTLDRRRQLATWLLEDLLCMDPATVRTLALGFAQVISPEVEMRLGERFSNRRVI